MSDRTLGERLRAALRWLREGRLRDVARRLRRWLVRFADLRPPGSPPGDREPAARGPSDSGAGARFIAGTARFGVMVRDYKLFVPPAAAAMPPARAAPAGTRLPLVVMLHGCTQDPDDFAAGTGMNRHAEADGLFVLYPAQSRRANRYRCWNWFQSLHQRRGLGEPALIVHLIEQLLRQWPIDPARVYVAGLSAGGSMAAILATGYPERFAAVAVHSGVAVGAARTAGMALAVMKHGPVAGRPTVAAAQLPPMLVIQGDRDEVVHPDNAERIVADAAGDGTADPVLAEGAADTRVDGPGRRFSRLIYRDAAGRVRVESWRVHGLGHAWSGGRPPASFTDPAGPDATAGMLRFFRESGSATAPLP